MKPFAKQAEFPAMHDTNYAPSLKAGGGPRTAYVLLWFPEPTETFLFKEVLGLWNLGLPLQVYCLYGPLRKKLTPEMLAVERPIRRMGIRAIPRIAAAAINWWWKNPRACAKLWRTVPLRRWKGWEKGGENLWAFFSSFYLASLCRRDGIEHLHAPWASGPATAVWCAATLLGVPFSFTARAWDIHPPDGALKDKIRNAAFIRCNARANIGYLSTLADLQGEEARKVRLAYNGISLKSDVLAPVNMRPPYNLLALGRFVGKKGFEYLVRACKILDQKGLDFRLTLAGSGPKGVMLRKLVSELGLEKRIVFPGFVPHNGVGHLFRETDVFVMPCVIDASGDRDGIPNVIMEALAHRLPVVASDVSGVGELIVHGETGLLVQQRDPEGLAQAIESMFRDRERALAMATAGRERALEMFDPHKNYRAIVELLEEFTPRSRS